MANDIEPPHDLPVLYAKATINYPLISYQKIQLGACISVFVKYRFFKKNSLHNFVQNLPPNVIDECCQCCSGNLCGGRHLPIK